MANTQSRGSGLFSGLVLITVGVLMLMHYYGHLELGDFVKHWWPLIIIFWGLIKLYERTAGRRFGGGGGAITAGEVLLVVGMLALMGIVIGVDYGKKVVGENWEDIQGDTYSFDDIEVPSQTIPMGARVNIRVGRGDITLRAADGQELSVTAKKSVRTWSETEANRLEKPVRVVIVKNGDAYEIHPDGYDLSNSRVNVDLEINIPKKSPVTVRTEHGDITISDQFGDVAVTVQSGDVEIRNTNGDVSVETHKGDVKISDTTGNVKVTGKGGEVEVINAAGSFTMDGDFYGPVRADKVAKGVRLISAKTDLTLSALSGHMEAGSGNLDIVGAPGNLSVRTRDTEVSVENAGGKVNVDNRNASVNVRFSSAPKDDISITNSSSEISLSLPGSSSFDIDADCRNCEIDSEFQSLSPVKSASGDSHLTAKYGTGRGPRITLKTSYGNIGLRRTSTNVEPMPMPSPRPMPSSKTPRTPATPIPPPTEQ
jgi:DUF4097 and DUF4098 domain-containing protein YvlB